MNYAARTPTADDRSALHALLKAVWGQDTVVHRLGERYDLSRVPRLVLVAGADLVGTAGWALLPPEFSDDADGEWVLDLATPPVMRGVLTDIAIVPAYRRRGAGTQLLAAVLTQLRQTGLNEVLTSVPPADAAGFAFLQKAGFRENGTGAVAGPWPTERVLTLTLR